MAFAQGAKLSPGNPAESERDRPQERARWFLRGRMVDGKPGAQQLHRAYEQKLNNRRLQGQARVGSSPGTTGVASPRPLFNLAPAGSPPWTFLGPAPTATAAVGSNQQNYGPAVGRVTAVAVDQGDPSGNTVYIGGASGGLWKTMNAVTAARNCDSSGVCTAPVTWTPLTDGQATLTVGSIAIQPGNSNLVLVGTGEANNSADSYYGLGILRSPDAGANWNLISSATCPTSIPACPSSGTVSLHGLGFTHLAFSTDLPNRVIATAAAASGGITVGAETGGSSARGIYYSTNAGDTWNRASVSDGPGPPDPGSANAVIYNSVQKKFYANIRYHGFYSSSDGANWTRIANQPAGIDLASCPSATDSSCPLYRAEMAIVPGRDEMYVWIYDVNENDRGIFQTKDGGQTWTSISTTGIDVCGDGANNGCGNDSTGQGTYNIALAAVPNGSSATDLYAGGVNEYKCTINPITNATCTSSPFLNLTHVYGCSPAGIIAHVHPDEHGIDFLGNDGTGAFFSAHSSTSPPVFFGNDGGVYRVLQSSSLTNGSCPAAGTTPASPFDNLNISSNFSMIQFVGFAHAAADATIFVGGTQDNGSPAASSAAPSSGNWLSVNNGDGGFNAINPTNANEWFTSNPAPLTSGGGIQRCTSGINCTFNNFFSVVTQDKLGGDESSFYTFFTLDPQASSRMLVGTCRVWRGNSNGTQSNALGGNWSVNNANGTPLSLNFDTLTTASCADPQSDPATFMVNTIAAGGPCNGPCDAGANPGSASGGGSQAIWAGMEGIADATSAAVQCSPGNGNGTPCGGQIWRTLAADTGTGTWSEVSGLSSHPSTPCTATPSACNINPKHYPISGIALDPHDATGNTAYVTVMGFGVGHVFKTTDGGANWAKLDGDPATTGLPDAPADAVVADPTVANLVYVGTDVGVFKSTGDGVWTELGPAAGSGSLPSVAITQLKIYNNPSDPNPLRLRASTYGRGLWEIPISPVPGYTMAISNSPLFAFAGQTSLFNGAITTFNGYNSSINISCTAGATAPPSTCPTSGSPVVVNSGSFTLTAGNSSVGDFNFNIRAVGTDAHSLTQQSSVAFHAVDFSLGSVSGSASVPQGNSADVSLDVSTASSQYTGNVTLTCAGQPAGTSCVFSPAVVSLTPGLTAHVNVTISTSASTTLGPYTVTITGTGALGTATKVHTTSLSLTVTTAALAFNVAASAISQSPVKPGQKPTAVVTVNSPGIYAGTLALSCSLAINGGAGCAMNPTSATLTTGQTAPPATMTVDTTGAAAANLVATARAFDASTNASKTVNVAYSVIDYSLAVSNPAATVPGGSTTAGVTIAAAGNTGYTGTVAATCAAPSPLTCSLNPAGPFTLTTTTTSVNATATITAPSGTAAKSYAVTIHTNDTAFTALTHDQTLNLAVQDFSTPAICNSATSGACSSSATVKAGSAATFNISVGALGGFGGAVTLACSAGLPALTSCTFSSNPVAPGGSSTLSIATTAASVSQLRRPASHGAAPLYAFWLAMPGIVGIIVIGIAPKRNRGNFLGVVGLMLLLGILIALPACGGGGGGTTTTPPIPKPGTPAGTYNITITGTSGSGATSLSHSTTITLTVQ